MIVPDTGDRHRNQGGPGSFGAPCTLRHMGLLEIIVALAAAV